MSRRWVSALLFALAVWPVWVVDVPPLQDLPNHFAAAVVQAHPDAYPDLVSNGFWKTNSTLFLFFHLFGGLGLRLAAKLFVTLTLAISAVCWPRAVTAFGGDEKLYSARFLLWPMIHSWFVAMGMLDYALAVPLALETLVQLDAYRKDGAPKRAAAAAVLAVLVWYTHVFALLVISLLVLIEIVRERKQAMRLVAPLVPALGLAAMSVIAQLGSETEAGHVVSEFQSAPMLLYASWSEWVWSMTKWTAISVVVALVLAWFGVKRFKETPTFFSPLALGVLVVMYFFLPHSTHRWFYVGARLLPFIWMACILRVPALPRWLAGGLAIAAVAWSVGLGVEYVQTARDWTLFSRGETAVPERSRLLPLVFDRKGPHGDNTWPMQHAWGLYVADKQTSAPLLFAHSRSFPVRYAVEPPERFHQLVLEQFPRVMKTPASFCAERDITVDCEAKYDAEWSSFWREAAPRFDRVLLYGATPAVRSRVPPQFQTLYDADGLVILATGP